MMVHKVATTTAIVYIKESTSAKAVLPWIKIAMKFNCSNAMDCHGKCLPLAKGLEKKVSQFLIKKVESYLLVPSTAFSVLVWH